MAMWSTLLLCLKELKLCSEVRSLSFENSENRVSVHISILFVFLISHLYFTSWMALHWSIQINCNHEYKIFKYLNTWLDDALWSRLGCPAGFFISMVVELQLNIGRLLTSRKQENHHEFEQNGKGIGSVVSTMNSTAANFSPTTFLM